MTSRSSHRYKATRAGIKVVHVVILRRIPGTPAMLRFNGIVYRALTRTIERFETWRARGMNA